MSLATRRVPLPSRHAVRTTLEELVGRDVDLADGVPPDARSTNVVAVYVTERLYTSAIAVCDLECAARLGGALATLPKGKVDEVVRARVLPPVLEERCYEVLSGFAEVFDHPGVPHVRLYEMYGPGAALPPDVARLGASVGPRMDVSLTIAGYGSGLFSVVRH